ncbi:MAG: type I restriction-modification system subunit M [Bacteroidetes bacterium]|nr:type I restriction-modification system subunit M [Bacteroidota bacterium]
MAIKKSELYSSLWASCDELRGGMDASQYKDYVLVMLFIKYISDKYSGVPYAPITVPEGASFKDMVALKGKPTIGDDINKKIIGRIAEANKLTGTIDVADFNNADKLGSGDEMVKRLSNLIAIFENSALDFSKNKTEGDDILGDAYEYLMRHFATESGKSKGQFYTPAEVSRVMAMIIGISHETTSASTTAYDPTGGSGSLLLKVADQSERSISIYLQEMDVATAALARMNMILHNNPTAEIKQGNTLANPLFINEQGKVKTFDFVVANPPFSYKAWSTGVDPVNDVHGRFQDYGIPPAKNGDYAFLLHIVRSMKSKGKGACIMPHGVLFRGNAEAGIRKNLIRKGYIKGIIGLPANLFYGTGIPACIIVLDKENAENRKSIFMIDASKGFMKDGNKNRLREQDIHRIVDVFNRQLEVPKYSRIVHLAEIEEKEYNLNIPRYIDSQEPEDIQDIEAHLKGGIPDADIDALQPYWKVYPSLRNVLFENSPHVGYSQLKFAKDDIKQTIFSHPEYVRYSKQVESVFTDWITRNIPSCRSINAGTKPKRFIHELSEDLLHAFDNLRLIDKYDVYQCLMNYWIGMMQDDVYMIVSDGWKVGNQVEWDARGKEFEGKIIPKRLLIDRFFSDEQKALEELESQCDAISLQIEELEEEHGGEEGSFADLEKVNKANVQKRLKELSRDDSDVEEERNVLKTYLKLSEQEAEANKKVKEELAKLNEKLLSKYDVLTEEEIKVLVVEGKWMNTLTADLHSEMQRISQRLTQRIKELTERYESPMPQVTYEVEELEGKVSAHLQKMGFVWK